MNSEIIKNAPYTLDMWDELVKRDPDAPIFVGFDNSILTRADADLYSAKVRAWLKQKNIGRNDTVLICLPRTAIAPTVMLGVWKAGAAFAIAESSYPPERIEYIRTNSQCKAVIDVNTWQDIIAAEPLYGYDIPDDHDAAFVIYTSGSTGNPKGVLHEYGNLKLDTLCGIAQGRYKLDKNMRVAHLAPFTFVASVKIFHYAFIYGLTIHVLSYDIIKNLVKLGEYFIRNKINCTFLVPSLLRMVGDRFSGDLKLIITGSEPANGIYSKKVDIINTYTMSESLFTVCEFSIDKEYDMCPVGDPNFPDIGLTVLDDDDKPAAAGEMGEICFDNPYFRGYIGLPEETAKALRGGLYHTGDIGFFDDQGRLVIAGRKNDMIKINGNRVEPSEIENAAKRILNIKDCVAKGFEKKDRSFLCLYYVAQSALNEEQARNKLSEYLPYYMIPSAFVKLNEIPHLSNGKVDRRSLPEPVQGIPDGGYVPPTNDIEKRICDAVEKVLGITRVGINDDFYKIGGDSLSSMNVLVETGLNDLNALDIFKGRTPAKIAKIYSANIASRQKLTPEQLEEYARKTQLPLTATQINIFDRQLNNPHAAMWNLPQMFSSPDTENAQKICDAVNKAVRHHAVFSMVIGFGSDDMPNFFYRPDLCPEVKLEDMTESEFEAQRGNMIKLHKLVGTPLFNVRVIRTEKNVYIFFDPHHIIIDGMGYQALFVNIAKAYKGEPLVPDTYCSCLAEIERNRVSGVTYDTDKKYFDDLFGGKEWCTRLLPDLNDKRNLMQIASFPIQVSIDDAVKFEKTSGLSRTALFTVAMLLSLAKMNHSDNCMAAFSFHNRTNTTRMNAVGLLVGTLPIGVTFSDHENLRQLYNDVKYQSAYAIEHAGYEWTTEKESVFVNDIFSVTYETAAIADRGTLSEIGFSDAQSTENAVDRNSVALRNFALLVYEFPEMIQPVALYSKSLYSEDLISRFGELNAYFIEKLIAADDPEKVPIHDLL